MKKIQRCIIGLALPTVGCCRVACQAELRIAVERQTGARAKIRLLLLLTMLRIHLKMKPLILSITLTRFVSHSNSCLSISHCTENFYLVQSLPRVIRLLCTCALQRGRESQRLISGCFHCRRCCSKGCINTANKGGIGWHWVASYFEYAR